MSEELPEHPDISTRFQRFRLLLWKSYLWHRYYWWWTILEILIRCLIPIFLIYRIPNDIQLRTRSVKYEPTHSKVELLNTSSIFQYLAYTPSVPFTDKLMNNVVEALGSFSQIELLKMKNEEDLEAFALNRSFYSDQLLNKFQLPLGIVFLEPPNDNAIPNKLIYKLRESQASFTNYKLILNGEAKFAPLSAHPYWQGFLAIQLVLNEEFTKMKLNRSSWSAPELTLQEFPDPEYQYSDIERDSLVGFLLTAFICIETALGVPFIASVIREKKSGAKELMKVYGVEEYFIWMSWFVIELVIIIVWVTISTILLKIPFKGYASQCILYVQFSVLWSTLFLFGISNVSLALFISAIFRHATVAALIYMFMNFVSVIIAYATRLLNIKYSSLLVGVVPSGNMMRCIRFLHEAEHFAFNLDWSSIRSSRDGESTITFPVHFVIFFLDIIIYTILALVIGSYQREFEELGQSPMVLFESFYRRFRKEPVDEPVAKVEEAPLNTDESSFMVSDTPKDDENFGEFALINPELTIHIEDLRKEYGSIRALNGIDVQFYDHEIGVILGHKGAGKTTLLSILSGRIPYDRGTILYKGADVNDDFSVMKNHMGICFEENRLFDYVSVLDHLVFYGMLKGLSRSSAIDEAEHYLMKMEMQDDEKSKLNDLSGSTRRKLSIAISLMGDRQVLLLDKPMVGLDSDAKTAVWNFLMGLRTDHTIVITSNYEREVERMADRITILENGSVIAHGTPKSLRKNIGMHYEISVAGKEANFAAITEIVQRNVNATVQHETEIEIVYDVPVAEASKFSKLFQNLESYDLGISEINLVSNSIERILIKSGSESADDSLRLPNSSELPQLNDDSSYENPSNGFRVKLRQMKTLFMKKFNYVIRDYKNICGRVILPTLIGLVMVMVVERLSFDPFIPLKVSPSSSFIKPSIMLQTTNSSQLMDKSFVSYINQEHVTLITLNSSADIHEGVLNIGKEDIMRYKREIIAVFKFETDNQLLVLFNPTCMHSLPVVLTIYSNTLLRNTTNDESLEIITYNHPIPIMEESFQCYRVELWVQAFIVLSVLFVLFGYFTIEIIMYLFELSSMEMANSLMHLQIMAGVPVWIYWFTTVVFDLLFFVFIISIRIVLFTLLDNSNKFFKYDFNFDVLLVLIIAFGITGLFYAYIVSFLYKPEKRTYSRLFAFNFACNLVVAMALMLIPVPTNNTKQTFYRYSWLTYVFMWFPFLNLPWTLTQYSLHWYYNNECSLSCSPKLRSYCEILKAQSNYTSVLEFSRPENEYAILLEMIVLIVNVVISGLVFILMNIGLVDFVHNFFKSKSNQYENYDEDVKHERSEIIHVKEDSRVQQVPLLVDGLSKNYIKRLKPITAVEDVSFMAEHGTCFGILKGHEGGKTTVFDMMTAKTIPTKGNVSIEGVEMRSNKKQYFSMIGYCPQSSPLLDKFTGREMLTLIASLSSENGNIENVVNKWIHASGLNNLENVKCEYYSRGNKRLLSTILALIGYPKVVYLDEPASGVDFASRRQLYDIIEQIKHSNRTVVLGTPSAIECYVLCDRLTILKNGIMHCLGHPHDLKKHYDLGYFIVIKVQSDIMSMREVSLLEEYMNHEFGSSPSHLIEHYRSLLQYQITDPSLQLSVIFKKMESIKEHNAIIEEYTVRTTTLEDIYEYFSQSK